MQKGLSPSDALAFRRRWALVAERAREEQASSTFEQRFDELERLMLSIDDFDWSNGLNDDAVVRARWSRLRERLSARPASL
jgi:hypothetical protein